MSLLLAVLAAAMVQTRVNVMSEPAGATAYVDGVNRGQTPLMLFDLKPGHHHVKYVLNGYVETDAVFTITSSPIVDVSHCLPEEKGLLLLKSDPAGANIKIDGMAVGETPRFIGNLGTKDVHTIVLSKIGYRDQRLSVKFMGRKPMVREEKLVLDSGILNVSSDPLGAEVTVNGIVRGKTPLEVRDIPKGVSTIRLRLDGFREDVRELRLSPGDTQNLSVTLKTLPGTLHLLSVPAIASFYLNGEARGKGPLSIPDLQPGDYEVRCEAEGFAPQTKTIHLGKGESVREEFKLENIMGRIELRTTPADAEVFLDGHRFGRTKANSDDETVASKVFAIEDITAGAHSIIVRKSGYADVTRSIEVVAKSTAQVPRIVMKKVFVPNVEVTTPDGVFRGVFKSQSEAAVVIETKPGTEYPIPRQSVRKIEYLEAK